VGKILHAVAGKDANHQKSESTHSVSSLLHAQSTTGSCRHTRTHHHKRCILSKLKGSAPGNALRGSASRRGRVGGGVR